jgi:hypothetical protein
MVVAALVRGLSHELEVVIRQVELDMMTRAEILQAKVASSEIVTPARHQDTPSLKRRGRSLEEPQREGPIVSLRPSGDGRALARALARVLVRRALVQEAALPGLTDCAIPEEAA